VLTRNYAVANLPYMYARVQIFLYRGDMLRIMGASTKPPKNIGELVDRIEQIREDLLAIQHSMEKMETVKTSTSSVKRK
jgi:hypothetical protein